VPPHHELNYLGDFKARLSHTVPGKGQIYSIHGNNDPAKLGKRATGGCIRMDNHEGLELIRRNILRPGTRVYITGGATKSS
jgi:lipoprotein-anchoring transpeptidase ErfK/SrfK